MTSESRASAQLASALSHLKKHNPHLSVRSLARQLQITPSYLSKIMTGKKRLPEHLVVSVARALQMDPHQTLDLQTAVLEDIEGDKLTKLTGLKSIKRNTATVDFGRYDDLGKDDFWLLEEWYYLPLLNLTTTEGFRPNIAWIAKRLSLPTHVVNSAMERLIEHRYLNSEFRRTKTKLRFPTGKSHPSIRRYHHKMMKMAEQKLTHGLSDKDFDERLISGVSLAGSSKSVQQARVILSEAMYKVAELMAEDSCDEVYHIGLQLFKVSTEAE